MVSMSKSHDAAGHSSNDRSSVSPRKARRDVFVNVRFSSREAFSEADKGRGSNRAQPANQGKAAAIIRAAIGSNHAEPKIWRFDSGTVCRSLMHSTLDPGNLELPGGAAYFRLTLTNVTVHITNL